MLRRRLTIGVSGRGKELETKLVRITTNFRVAFLHYRVLSMCNQLLPQFSMDLFFKTLYTYRDIMKMCTWSFGDKINVKRITGL